MRDERREILVQDADEPPGGFLARWSRRKRGLEAEEVEASPVPAVAAEEADEAAPESVQAAGDDPVDPRTGKRMSELTDEDMPDVESLTAESDVSMFMAKNISSALRMRALNKIFMSPKYNVYCVCAEYAEDYTNFTPLGDIVPHDLKQAIAREAGKLYERLTGKGVTVSKEELESRIAAQFRGEPTPDLETEYLARVEHDTGLQQSAADDRSSATAQQAAPDLDEAARTEAT